jgi:predicted phosphate transport protein (TIGR00153 family)
MAFVLNDIFQFLTPKDKKFFPLFEQATAELVELASTLNEAVNAPKDQREEHFNKINRLEASIDVITHKVNMELSRNFLTPFDREDIHSLMKSIDDVTDFLHGSASRMKMYQVEKITKSIRKLTEINLEACLLIQRAVTDLKEHNDLKRITVACKKISKLESKADVVFDNAVMDIFENETDAIKIIKYKEVLTALEDASDKCKDVANVLETIVVKYS